MSDVLTEICERKRAHIAERKRATPEATLLKRLDNAPPPRGFADALAGRVAAGGYGLIAEIKKASPSGGLIRPEFDPAALALAYMAGGATCLSVLTDEKYFQGSPEHLKAARAAVDLPVLRKDFILEPWQVYESRAMGADCILLIMAALDDTTAIELESLARDLDLDVLVEAHNEAELQRALGLQSKLIGINNRNLKTLQVDIRTTEELAPLVPPDRFLIGESGLRNHADIQRLAALGVHSFLVGEHLMRQPDVTEACRTLLHG